MFPIIKNISDVLPALVGHDEFIVAEREGHQIINYLVSLETTFEDPNEQGISDQEKLFRQIRRECRGIIFDSVTGDIIRRPLAKFFNLNEKPEAHFSKVDLSEPHVILAKEDGSFIAPYIVNDKLIYGTKMGDTNVAQIASAFVAENPVYDEFSLMLIEKGYTPVFEFLSPANRIVLRYDEPKMVLLAVRNMITGEYHEYSVMESLAAGFGIPVVFAREGSVENMERFAEETAAMCGIEGFVIRFVSGLMLKVKCDEYRLKHKTKDSISQEKNLLELIFSEKVDDMYSILDEADSAKVKRYADSVLESAYQVANMVEQMVKLTRDDLQLDRKTFAIEWVPKHKEYSSLLFTVFNGADAWETVKKYVLNNCQTQSKVDKMRHIIGELVWNDVYISVETNE